MKLLAALFFVATAAGCAGTKPSVFLPDAIHVFYIQHSPDSDGDVGKLPISISGSGSSIAGGFTWGWGSTQSARATERSARATERMMALMVTAASVPPAGVSVIIKNAASAAVGADGPEIDHPVGEGTEAPDPVIIMGLSPEVWAQVGIGIAAFLTSIAGWIKLRNRRKAK